MQVAIRVDASVEIGTGHVMRCLTLSYMLRQQGASVQFICREHTGHLCDFIAQQGFIVHRLPPPRRDLAYGRQDLYEQWLGESWEIDANQTNEVIRSLASKFDILIVDHYSLDEKWERQLRQTVTSVVIIDDLANRHHDCDLLLDQNLYDNMNLRYKDLLPKHCLQLLGPRYALLRDEFLKVEAATIVRNGEVQRIFVFFGGSDPTNETEKSLRALELLNRPDLTIDIVVGSSNINRHRIADLCLHMPNVHYHCQINNIADLMVKADIAIGAGGSSIWERCSLGLPSIIVTTAENQVEVTGAVAKKGAIYYLGNHCKVSSVMIAEVLKHLLSAPELLVNMSRESVQIMGQLKGCGSESVAQIIMSMDAS